MAKNFNQGNKSKRSSSEEYVSFWVQRHGKGWEIVLDKAVFGAELRNPDSGVVQAEIRVATFEVGNYKQTRCFPQRIGGIPLD